MTEGQWDREVDVLVAGTGNGGLTAALCNWEMGCKDILIIEKGTRWVAPVPPQVAGFGYPTATMPRPPVPRIRGRQPRPT